MDKEKPDLKQVRATLPRPEFPPIMGSRTAVNAQNDTTGSDDSFSPDSHHVWTMLEGGLQPAEIAVSAFIRPAPAQLAAASWRVRTWK